MDASCYTCHQPTRPTDQRCPSCGAPLQLGGGRYRVVAHLGGGGSSDVYRADDAVLLRPCAIKLPRQGADAPHRRLLDEARLLAQRTQRFDFVVGLYDVELRGPSPFLVMEYLEGQTLDRRQPLPWHPDAVEQLLRTLLGYLGQLHAAGIVHRDLKPDNIIASDARGLALLDFNIAKLDTRTQTVALRHSPGFSPIEQSQGLPTDARSDLYSLGATAFFLLAGQPPPPAEERAKADDLTLPRATLAQMSPLLRHVLTWLLEVEPERRAPSAEAALRRLSILDERATVPIAAPVPRSSRVIVSAMPVESPEAAMAPTPAAPAAVVGTQHAASGAPRTPAAPPSRTAPSTVPTSGASRAAAKSAADQVADRQASRQPAVFYRQSINDVQTMVVDTAAPRAVPPPQPASGRRAATSTTVPSTVRLIDDPLAWLRRRHRRGWDAAFAVLSEAGRGGLVGGIVGALAALITDGVSIAGPTIAFFAAAGVLVALALRAPGEAIGSALLTWVIAVLLGLRAGKWSMGDLFIDAALMLGLGTALGALARTYRGPPLPRLLATLYRVLSSAGSAMLLGIALSLLYLLASAVSMMAHGIWPTQLLPYLFAALPMAGAILIIAIWLGGLYGVVRSPAPVLAP